MPQRFIVPVLVLALVLAPVTAATEVAPSAMNALSEVAPAATIGAIEVGPSSVAAQGARQFRARLAPVPLDVAMQATISGSGSATATLAGNTLTITGSFADLRTPATIARIHVAAKGLRGPSILELKVSGGTSGTLSGAFELTAAQLEDLTKSRFYLQLHSEKAPDGNLWGWLLPQETRR